MRKMLLILPLLFLIGCSSSAASMTRTEFLFDTVITISVNGKDDKELMDEIFETCREFELEFSKLYEESEVSKINNSNGEQNTISSDLACMLNEAIKISELSDGNFDVTVYPLVDLWGFSKTPSVPTSEEIDLVLENVSYKNIHIEEDKVTLLNGAKIDLGAIAKGYIGEIVKEQLLQNGVDEALINFGGNIITVGDKNNGDPWTIGVEKPFSDDVMMFSVEVTNQSVVTAGVYERNFTQEDELYHHILDPNTGYPCDSGLLSVTIITENSMIADALSTACMVSGYENSLELLEMYEEVEAIFITNDYEILYTDGIGDEIPIEIY